ncbi:glycosyltransferase involved in cell wall biosynthesis [Paenibacillus endophyticus]|uniref:Glycosyltransferase involved in cell wall biosynthesis n=1 Tax=Paenibacillus endophyticus TaxID=1294268 RepID=A0A7W5CCH7_9BACL|nr:glycosyltransferase family 4 protein [Paenibacillus endophyticus]MBB3155192.1 glycosyltransferase involved in cell wall biosynthesis [Paenibacillus endophyticus]
MARVLHISEFTKGGIETHLNEVLTYQSGRHDIYLMASEQNSSPDTLQISRDRLTLYPYKRKPAYFVQAIKAIHRTVKEFNPDIVHVHGTFAGVFLRTLFFFKSRRPIVIYNAHGWAFLMDIKPWKQRIFALVEKTLALRTDYIINISKHEYNMAMHYGLPARKSGIVYNGVSDTTPSNTTPFETESDRINLLYVGRFDRQKGFDLLLEVFNEHKFKNVSLYLVGDTVLEAVDYHFPENTVKLGWVDNSQIDRYMNACDAVIIPSRWEGFGIVAIEALRNKKPVIASNRGALPEIIKDGVNGYVFDFENKSELAGIINRLDKDTLAAMGQAGLDIFQEKFHSNQMNSQIERLYEDAMHNRKRLKPVFGP